MTNQGSYDLVVIGGGPAGYVGAIRAAQLGMRVVCVERDKLGGVCLNWGCIPTKALLQAAELYHWAAHEAGDWGVNTGTVSHDFAKVIGRSRTVAGNLNKGIHALFKKNKIEHIEGSAFIPARGKVEVRDAQGKAQRTLAAKHILIATGARPRPLPGADFDGKTIISSREAMTITEQPKKLVIVGAGAIGMEFAYFYHCFGTQVTIVEMLDHLLPIEDQEVSKTVARAYKKLGITALPGHKTLKVEKTGNGAKVTVAPADAKDDDIDKQQTFEADKVLVAIGVQGLFADLFDQTLGVHSEKGHIKVDRVNYQTSLPGIYAAGDVIGPPWLAHVASEEAIVCVERIVGHETHDIDYDAIPGCTYCQPQVASIGRTEQALAKQGLKAGSDYRVGKFPFTASGKAQATGHTDGFVKILSGAKHGEILGCHMVGANVTELAAEIGLAMRLEATADELIATMHAHPTLSEAIHEAALGTQGRMVHF
jgi:dihydrolipoamide dehydrogenase